MDYLERQKTVVILNGYPGSGKTTFSEKLANKEPTIIRSSVGLVKELAEGYFDWNGVKDDESRKFLSDFKRFLVNETDLIKDDLTYHYNKLLGGHYKYLIIDIREPEEIEKYKNYFNAVTVFVRNFDGKKRSISNNSDAGVEDYDYDIYIDNIGSLENLDEKVDDFIGKMKMKHMLSRKL